MGIRVSDAAGGYRAAYAGLYLFTLLLYLRPQDLAPALGAIPLAKMAIIATFAAYLISKLNASENLVRWTLELYMLLSIAALAIIHIPFAASPQESVATLQDPFLKMVAVFGMMTGLIVTLERLRSLLRLVVICGAWLSVGAIRSFQRGEFTADGLRIEGIVGGIFENPNDLATALNLLLPLAAGLALTARGAARLFYTLSALLMAAGVMVTFSRGGFLGLAAAVGVLFLKRSIWIGSGERRISRIGAAAVIACALLIFMPGGYVNRVSTIFRQDLDETGSAQERRLVLGVAARLAVRRAVIGVGMGNFHIYSYQEKVAHNSYLEIAAELGILGLAAYLVIILAPLRALWRIEKACQIASGPRAREMLVLSVALQAAFVSYMICSVFASIQYLWYLYYLAAYAVALRHIYAAEGGTAETTVGAGIPGARPARSGILWKSGRLRPAV